MPRPRPIPLVLVYLTPSRWTRPLGLLAGALLLLQLGGTALRTSAAPLAPLPVLAATGQGDVTQGALRVTRGEEVVECPLRHTDVRAEVSGFIARVRVTQTFENPYDEPIEALYVFPLPHGSAVDEMTMVVGQRRIAGVVKRRREAREAYEQALAQGRTASLLEQERPNIFTQSVGNIPPRQQVRVEIAYVDVLPYEGGRYEFHFPMVVGPRYIPGTRAVSHTGTGWAPDTDRVPDASRITPPVLKPGQRNGHDVSLTVSVDAGVPIRRLQVHNHETLVQRGGGSRATVTLSPRDTIPNKDFVLSYFVAGERPETALLAHSAPGEDGYFLLMVQPREMEQALRASPPRDVCFLIDVSGSMSGQPIAKVSEAMERFFQRMRPQDRLQVVTFAGDATRVFPSYLPATPDTVQKALSLTRAMQGGGGTEMLQGIRAVLADPVEADRVRIVVMLTDGYIGNEDEIIGEVGRRAGDQLRFWTVGMGASPNRHLLDGVARQGGGASEVLGLQDDPAPLVDRVMDRVQRAQLSRVQLDWGGMEVFETYPTQIGELWAGRPVFLLGRYRGAGEVRVTLSGLAEGVPVSFEVPVSFASGSAEPGPHAVLAAAWARKKIEHLGDQMAVAGESEELVEEVTGLALQYRLMSAYTSFVAVDESQPAILSPDPPRRMLVPVPLPDGVSYEGIFGDMDGMEVKHAQYVGGRVAANGISALQAESVAPSPLFRAPAPPIGDGKRAKPARKVELVRVDEGMAVGVVGGVPGGVMGGAMGAFPAAPPATFALPGEREADEPQRSALLASRADAHRRRALVAVEEARRRKEAGNLEAAARELTLAAVLEQARLRLGAGDDGTLAAVLAELAKVGGAYEEQAGREMMALQRPLQLVLRNMDLSAALEAVAKAAGVALDVAPGSLGDVAEAFGAGALRVGYLDLRGASAARALTWLTQPAALHWSVRAGRVSVRSARRAGGPWVYDVGGMPAATPESLLERERAVRAAAAAVDPAATVVVLTPDLLLVRASAPAQQRAADLLRARRAATAQQVEDRQAALELRRARAAVQAWTWPLLTAALAGRVDDAAASELLEAWSTPGLAAPTDVVALRSLWAIARARAVRASDATLTRLWDAARAAMQAARATPAVKPTGEAALYALLLKTAGVDVAEPDFTSPSTEAGIARLLSGTPGQAQRAAEELLRALSNRSLRGDDALVLAALALHRQGGETWARFRQGSAELARATGASGAALQVVNRLEGGRL